MEAQGRALIAGAGVPGDAVHVQRACDVRYEGQGSEVTVAVPGGALSARRLDDIRSAFEDRYRTAYGRIVPQL